MKKKNSKFNRFVQRMRFKYRLSILNENTLEESWHFRLSRFTVFMYFSIFTLITFALITILIFTTPIRYYLPGYGDSGNRDKIISESMRTDSLEKSMNLQSAYLEIVKGIISGDVPADSIVAMDSIQIKEKAKIILEKSKKEQNFCKKFEELEKYNLSSIDSKPTESSYVFFPPTKGSIASSFNLNEKRTGIYMTTSPNESVVSVLAGTIISASFSFTWNWVIIVQHESNYLSVYKNITNPIKREGDKVKAGECIAITGFNSSNNNGEQFYFELWKSGQAINPEEYIIF